MSKGEGIGSGSEIITGCQHLKSPVGNGMKFRLYKEGQNRSVSLSDV